MLMRSGKFGIGDEKQPNVPGMTSEFVHEKASEKRGGKIGNRRFEIKIPAKPKFLSIMQVSFKRGRPIGTCDFIVISY
jgi:hypothetical protein